MKEEVKAEGKKPEAKAEEDEPELTKAVDEAKPAKKVNLNTATKEKLLALEGVRLWEQEEHNYKFLCEIQPKQSASATAFEAMFGASPALASVILMLGAFAAWASAWRVASRRLSSGTRRAYALSHERAREPTDRRRGTPSRTCLTRRVVLRRGAPSAAL